MHIEPWTGTTAALKAQQLELKKKVSLEPMDRIPRLIGGVDISLNRGNPRAWAGIVVLDYETLQIVDEQGVNGLIEMPYIPGYLSFREVPLLLQAWNNLRRKPDLVIVDGHGILHPRQLGVATHFGLAANVPTVGCAKKKLVGETPIPGASPNAVEAVQLHGEVRGFCLRSRKNANPVFVSPGTGISLNQSLEVVRHCLRGYRLPEPTRLAHSFVNRIRKHSMSSEAAR